MMQKKRKYYRKGERVWIKELKKAGVIVDMDILPKAKDPNGEGKYKATVEYELGSNKVQTVFDLWQITKYRKPRMSSKRRNNRRTRRVPKRDVVYFAKVRPDAKIPSRDDENGWYDVYACFDEEMMVVQPHSIAMIPTGIASAFSSKYRFSANCERGSTGVIAMMALSGKIDSGYRDEWFIVLYNGNDKPIAITKETDTKVETEDYIMYPYSKAICQAGLEIVPQVEVREIPYEELKAIPSKRGTGKLGSSGK